RAVGYWQIYRVITLAHRSEFSLKSHARLQLNRLCSRKVHCMGEVGGRITIHGPARIESEWIAVHHFTREQFISPGLKAEEAELSIRAGLLCSHRVPVRPAFLNDTPVQIDLNPITCVRR